MKHPRQFSAKNIFLVIFLATVCWSAKANVGCPPAEDIAPCVCFNSPYTVLRCASIQDERILKDVFSTSKDYTYREVHFEYIKLKTLPKELFENNVVKDLHLINSTVNSIFAGLSENLRSIRKLHFENTVITEITKWESLQALENLQILDIYYNKIEVIDESFSKYVTKDISQIAFYATKTKEIKPGAFVPLTKLSKLAIDGCPIKEISRDIFPRPSNVQHLYFNDNELKAIPEDMFTDMPQLRTVGLRNNELRTIPGSAFGGSAKGITWLLLEGNPLKCDCSLKWLITNKPQALSGRCSLPVRLLDKSLDSLSEKDLKCSH